MKQIIFATGNAGKMKEIREILNETGWNVLSLKDAGIDADIEENGTTFEENAKIKAEGIRNWCLENGIPGCSGILAKEIIVLADDSGLEIDALNKVMLPIWHHPEKRKKESVSMFSDFSFYCIRCFASFRYCWYSSHLSQMKHPF